MSGAGEALARALVGALQADVAVQAAVGGAVYDTPPPGAVPPYMTVGPNVATDASSFSVEAREHRLRVSVWEMPLRSARCAGTLAAVEAVAAGLAPVLDGHRLEWVRFVRSVVGAEAPGGPMRGLIEFAARTVVDGGANG